MAPASLCQVLGLSWANTQEPNGTWPFPCPGDGKRTTRRRNCSAFAFCDVFRHMVAIRETVHIHRDLTTPKHMIIIRLLNRAPRR